MSRSLRVAPEYIQKAKLALQRNGYPSKTKFAEHVEPSLSTVKNFFSGKPVDFEYFVEISEKLGLDWQAIAYKEPETQPLQPKESSPFIIGPTIIHPRSELDYFMDVVSDNLQTPTVILLDEIGVGLQRCPELDDGFWESLRSLATNHTGGNLAFVLATHESPIELARHTGHSSPFFNIFGYTATLGPLTETEARELIASSPIPFPDEDVAWILAQSECWPLLLQILCRERLFSLEDGEMGEDWRKYGLEQIKPFTDDLLIF
jgi:hypothetical protein